MLKIEAETLEVAYSRASEELGCSVTELEVQVIQTPSKGLLNLFFRKPAIIVARYNAPAQPSETKSREASRESVSQQPSESARQSPPKELNDTILPQSFVTDQSEEEEVYYERESYEEKSAAVAENFFTEGKTLDEIAQEVHEKINALFANICFDIDEINVSVYDDETLLIEFTGEDAALLIGKEGYRYKALSYMLFNWINAEYQMQLRLEIAEFLKNQEESVGRYLTSVYENVDRDGRSQTKILDGVLVQIALRELRGRYPDKYVAIRSTRDGSKFIIINDYNEY